jgi:hypothetical protein
MSALARSLLAGKAAAYNLTHDLKSSSLILGASTDFGGNFLYDDNASFQVALI